MRTTIELNDHLFRQAKRKAAEEGITLREVIERALRKQLGSPGAGGKYALRWRTTPGGRLQPGVCLEDRDALFDLMDGRR